MTQTTKPKKSVKKPQTRGKSEEKPDRNPDGTFAEGREKTGGREEGTKNFETEFNHFLEIWAKEKGYTLEEAKKLKFYARIKGLLKSEFNFHRDTDDRIYGKSQDNLDLTSGGETIFSWKKGKSK